jgi:hypothetical protein
MSVNKRYQLITKRHSKDDQQLHYGDLVRLWHPQTNSYLYTHNRRYQHEGSSYQFETLGLGSHNRVHADQHATWWRVLGPHGATSHQIGEPVDTAQAIRLVAQPGLQHASSLTKAVALKSYALKNYEYYAPLQEKMLENNGLKQEVSSHYTFDHNNNWIVINKQKDASTSSCSLGDQISLMHQRSQHYLRSKEQTILHQRGSRYNKSPNDFYEISGIDRQQHPETTFTIALIARPQTSPAPKAEPLQSAFSARNYVNQFDDHRFYTIRAHDYYHKDQNIAMTKPLLLRQGRKNKSLAVYADGEPIPKEWQTVDKLKYPKYREHRVLFKLQPHYQEGTLSIKAGPPSSNLMLTHKKQQQWSSLVTLNNQQITREAHWIPMSAGKNQIYLKNKKSNWFLAVEKEGDTIRLVADKQRKTIFEIG